MPDRDLKWFVKHAFGIFTVLIVYIFFFKIYVVTLIFTIIPFKNPFDIIHAIFFSILALLALWSHSISMTQQPGILPQNYTTLNEYNITLKFTKLFDERDLQHIGPVYRRLKRSGEDAKAEDLIEDQKRQSVYLKVKPKVFGNMESVEATQAAIVVAEEQTEGNSDDLGIQTLNEMMGEHSQSFKERAQRFDLVNESEYMLTNRNSINRESHNQKEEGIPLLEQEIRAL